MPRIPKSIKSTGQLFQQSGGRLKSIFIHTQALLSIESVVSNIIPGDIRVASFSKGILHLVTPSAPLATRIKYSQKALISTLRRRNNRYSIKTITVSVRPTPSEPVQRLLPSARAPSAENARYIANAAQYIEDEPLRKALIKLSERHTSD